MCLSQGDTVNLVNVWRESDTGREHGANGLVRIAMRIMAIVANSACTERVFSKFGTVHTKIRNRMHPDKARKMTLLKMDIVQTYGAPPRGRKRKHSDDDDDEETSVQAPANQSETAPANSPTSTSSDSPNSANDSESDDSIPSFSNVVQNLIEESADSSPTDLPSSSTRTTTIADSESRLLKNLFQFPTPSNPSPASLKYMQMYWPKGEAHLRIEEEYQELLNEEERAENLAAAAPDNA
jgi:hypothetical protein